LMVRLFLSFCSGILGFIAMIFFYPFWWTCIATTSLIYYILFLFFSPLWYGFDKVVTEMGHHRISLTIIFMLLTIQSSKSFLVTLATAGIVVGSIYMLYLLIKNKFKK